MFHTVNPKYRFPSFNFFWLPIYLSVSDSFSLQSLFRIENTTKRLCSGRTKQNSIRQDKNIHTEPGKGNPIEKNNIKSRQESENISLHYYEFHKTTKLIVITYTRKPGTDPYRPHLTIKSQWTHMSPAYLIWWVRFSWGHPFLLMSTIFGKRNPDTAHPPPANCSSERGVEAMLTQKLWEWPIYSLFKAHALREKPYPTLPWWPGIRDWIAQRSRIID